MIKFELDEFKTFISKFRKHLTKKVSHNYRRRILDKLDDYIFILNKLKFISFSSNHIPDGSTLYITEKDIKDTIEDPKFVVREVIFIKYSNFKLIKKKDF